jgi:hypothetical protein
VGLEYTPPATTPPFKFLFKLNRASQRKSDDFPRQARDKHHQNTGQKGGRASRTGADHKVLLQVF